MDTRAKMYFDEVREGMDLPPATYGPMDRYKYIPIAVILRDMNPLHLDRVYARERGMPDVVQQGPLNETYLYRFLTDWLHRPWDIRKTKLRFAANVFPDDMLTCGGTVTRTYHENGEPRVDCQVWQQNQKGEKILFGEATFTLPERREAGEMGKRGNGKTESEKTRLRRLLRDHRRSLSSGEVTEKSRLLFERLLTCPPFQQAQNIVLYSADENEVQTEAIWDEATRRHKAVYYPRISTDNANLEFVRRVPGQPLVSGTFGILIPPGDDLLTNVSATDVILTPGVGFDREGHRLGRGRGYYDRAFRGVLAGGLRIALAYESQLVDVIPTAADDEPVHFIVTETRFIDCTRASQRA